MSFRNFHIKLQEPFSSLVWIQAASQRAAATWSGRNFSSLIWGSLFTVSSLTLESNPAGCAVSLLVRLIAVTCHMMNFKLIKWKCSGFSLAVLRAVVEVNVSDPRRRSGATDGCPLPHRDIQAGLNAAEISMCYRGGTKVLAPLCICAHLDVFCYFNNKKRFSCVCVGQPNLWKVKLNISW